MKDYNKEIGELETKLSDLKKERGDFEKKPNSIKLATLIHDKMCSLNHTDGCAWYYEKWEDMGHYKKRYHEKATEILKIVDYKTAFEIINKL